jgi:hypothetical protein
MPLASLQLAQGLQLAATAAPQLLLLQVAQGLQLAAAT